jgi:hypothetical protein
MIALRVQDPTARHEEAFKTGRLSRPEAKPSTKARCATQPPSPIPLCDLRALCAMLFPKCASFPPRSQAVHPSAFRHPASIPLCDLRALCAMLFPNACLSRPEAKPSTQARFATQPPSPFVTSVPSVRCSFPKRVFPAQKPSRPPKRLPSFTRRSTSSYWGEFRRAIKAVDSTTSVTTPSTANLAINSRTSLDRSSAFAPRRSREVTENERARSVKR